MTGTESSIDHHQDGILEVAILDLRGRHAPAFETALSEALPLIRRQPGCRSAEICPCLENPQRYLLLVNWADVAAHEQGSRQSEDYRAGAPYCTDSMSLFHWWNITGRPSER